MEDSLTPYLMASLRARAARRRAEGLERELQSMWDAAEAQRAWMAELQEDLTAALEDGQEQHDAAAALAKEVDALRARLAGALQTTSPPAHHMPTPSLRQARHSQLEESQAQHDAAAALAKEVDALRARLAGALQTTQQAFQCTGSLLRQALHSAFEGGVRRLALQWLP